MASIAILITDMFEDSEFIEPANAFRQAGHKITHVGLKAGQTVRGKKEGTEVKIDISAGDCSSDSYDALFIPGGYSPDKLRVDEDAVELTRQFMMADKPVFSICHGPQLLITAKTLQGRTLTGWKSIRQDIINAGADFIDSEVVVDGNLVTSRNPGDLPPFIETCLQKLAAV
ncbi:MAG: type 1 glutamine amidotransferase [Desulfobulbaceae bacterium]|nr:type 1 glutamine amidotransferase [Desulfobulbaceae bacterium]